MAARRTIGTLITLVLCVFAGRAQAESVPKTLTLPSAVEYALANYPAIRAALERSAAARAGVGVAQTEYLPRGDLLWQENRATRNNVSGVLLPQSVVPTISGPVLATNSWASAWGSAAGALFAWEPFDFGRRHAEVEVARALSRQASAGVEITQLDVATAAATDFLTLAAAEQVRGAAQANVERLQVFGGVVHTLVRNELRPGADAARADAELAAARNQLIQAEQTVAVDRINLGEALGIPGTELAVDAAALLHPPRDDSTAPPLPQSHPLAVAQAAVVDTAQARERALARSYFPRLNFQAAVYGRGSGALPEGQLEGGTSGLRPDTGNWASGVTVSFPVFDIFQIHARREVETRRQAAEEATYERTLQQLTAEQARARALLDGARRIAANTPIELQAAQQAEAQARARYRAALSSVTEVAETQRLLAQAESDDAVARFEVWRAELIAARADGDLKPFLQRVSEAATGGDR